MSLLTLAVSPANDNQIRSLVYFIDTETGYLKIGISNNPSSRRDQLQIGCPVPIRLACVWDTQRDGIDPRKMEQSLHRNLAPYKTHGEWFKMPPPNEFQFAQKLAWARHYYPHIYDAWWRKQENPG
jgi:hypothetical protein